MGANAQTTVPTFVASQVLTADQMNQSARTGIPVFASTVTRDAGFGGTGEKTLAEGQLCYVEGTGLQSYNGSSWVTWGAAPSSGLNFVTGATFSTVTSVSLPQGTFSSTYDNYKVIFQLSAVTTGISITGRYRTSGTDNSTARYYQGTTGFQSSNAADNLAQATQTSFSFGSIVTTMTNAAFVLNIDFYEPNINRNEKLATGSKIFHNDNATYSGQHLGLAFDNNGTAFQADSFSFISGTASSMTGSYQVYGYGKS
jgi:hypothetical protein